MTKKSTKNCIMERRILLVVLLNAYVLLCFAQLQPPVVTLEFVTEDGIKYPQLSWEPVDGAEGYNVYSSPYPCLEDWGEPVEVFGDSVFNYTSPQSVDELGRKYFYRVTALEGPAGTPEMVLVEGDSPFWISKYLVTQEHYAAVMEDSPRDNEPSHFADNPEHPVEMVTWFDAIEYCNRLSIREGLTPVYTYLDAGTDPDDWPDDWNSIWANHANISEQEGAEGYGYRLAHEVEWEHAARGGVAAQDANPPTYNDNWAGTDSENELEHYAWYEDNSEESTQPAGTKRPNELDIYDMSGNVREWVWNLEPVGPWVAAVTRGGGWHQEAGRIAIPDRHLFPFLQEAGSYNYIGFRVVRTNR